MLGEQETFGINLLPDFIALNQSERANNVLTKSMVKLKLIINGPTLKKSEKISEISRAKTN